MKNTTLPPSLQDSSQCVGESGNSLKLLSRASSRVGKQVHGDLKLVTLQGAPQRVSLLLLPPEMLLLRPWLYLL